MKCKLCKKDRELCKSHVIPEFIYTDLYDEKHTFQVLSTSLSPTRKIEQKGIREKLLCKDCESLLSRYEDYAKRVIKGGTSLKVTKESNLLKIQGLDYKKFKLFQISIIYRSSIAEHPIFKKVRLGNHQEKIREMLLNENPGKYIDYPCLMFGLSGDRKLTGNFIDQPDKLRLDNIICYRFIFSGFVWVFFVSSHSPNKMIRQHLLNEKGDLLIWIKPFHELEYLRKFAVDLNNKGML